MWGGLDSGGGRVVVGGGREVVVPEVDAAIAAAAAMTESKFRVNGLVCLADCELQKEHHHMNVRNRRLPNPNS